MCAICNHFHVCFCRRNKVAAAAWKTWPGNKIPTFKNNPCLLKQLDTLVKSLLPDCKLPFFDEKAIRSHIMDTLSERRRQIKNGHDYENVSSCTI